MAPRSSAALLLASGAARFLAIATLSRPWPLASSFVCPISRSYYAHHFFHHRRHRHRHEVNIMPVRTRRGLEVSSPATTPIPVVRTSSRRTLTVTYSQDSSGAESSTPAAKRVKTEQSTARSTTLATPDLTDAKPASTPQYSRKKKAISKKGSPPSPEATSPPADFEKIYSLVEELRQDRTAPVDHSGSEALPEKHRGEVVFRFQVLVALMLSSQTKDAVVGEAMRNLQAHGLDLESILETPHDELNFLIKRVGFHNNKTKYIKQAVEIIRNEYDGDIPPNAVEIMKLPGVGPKMAYIVENVAWNATTGIGVDTHMHRMFNELRWVKSKNPEQTRVQLEAWLPRDYWASVNVLWVGMGQEVQQFKPKVIEKALNCSRPAEALRLLKRLGVNITKEGDKLDLTDRIRDVMRQ